MARFQSVSGYFQRSMDLLEPSVRDELFNPDRPIRTKDRSNPSTYYGPDSRSVHSLVADGCLIEGEVENSIISRGVIIEKAPGMRQRPDAGRRGQKRRFPGLRHRG